MEVKGEVCSGPHRGRHLIRYLKHRLKGIIGFEPYPGTLDIKLNNPVDISQFGSCKTLEHVNPGGAVIVECFLIPAKLKKEECWAMQQTESEEHAVPKRNIIEILSQKNLKEKLNVEDGDKVKVILKEK